MSEQERTSRLASFLAEMRRRHVWRAAIGYAAVAFVLLQAAEIVIPAFDFPDWALRLAIVFTVLGFPVVLVLAWIYELTPHGIRRTERLHPETDGSAGTLLPRVALLVVTLLAVAGAGWWSVRVTVPADDAAEPSGRATPALTASAESVPIRSLAVLPLDDFSSDEGQGYFADGMHEELISQLSRISSVRILSRHTVAEYERAGRSMPTIARDLGVEGVVEGSVLRADGRVRITVQLIHGPTDRHLWSNSYERELEDVIALQGEVARAIAHEIEAELMPEDEAPERVASAERAPPEAREAYTMGRMEQSKGTPEGWRAALEYYRDAIRRDSTFAAAYAGLAGAQLLLELGADDTIDIVHVRQAAERALQLDENMVEAEAVLGMLESAQALTDGQRRVQVVLRDSAGVAVEMDSTIVAPPMVVAPVTEIGRQAHTLIRRNAMAARAPAAFLLNVAIQAHAAGQREQARELLTRALEESPELRPAWDALEYLHAAVGDYDEALAVRLRRAEALGGADAVEAAREVAEAYREEGPEAYWEALQNRLEDRLDAGVPVSRVQLAATHAALGEDDAAMSLLDGSLARRDPYLATLWTDPVWDPLRDDMRFRRLLFSVQELPARPPAPPGGD